MFNSPLGFHPVLHYCAAKESLFQLPTLGVRDFFLHRYVPYVLLLLSYQN